jgi:hypothetical protein
MRGNRDLPAGRFPYEVLAPHQREYRASWHEEEWRSGQVHIGNPHNSVNKIPVTLHETEEKGFLHYRLSGGALGSNAIEMMFEPEDKPGYFTTFYDGYVSSEIFFSVDSPFRISRFDVVLDGAQYTFVGSPRDALLVTEHRTLLWGCEAKRTIVLVAPGMGQFYALKPDNIALLEFKPQLFRRQGWEHQHTLYGKGHLRFEPDDLYTSFKLMFYPEYDMSNPRQLDHVMVHPTDEGKYPAWVAFLHNGDPAAKTLSFRP